MDISVIILFPCLILVILFAGATAPRGRITLRNKYIKLAATAIHPYDVYFYKAAAEPIGRIILHFVGFSLAVLILTICVVAVWYTMPEGGAKYMLTAAIMSATGYFFVFAKKSTLQLYDNAEELLAKDKRSPVLYLRPFFTDLPAYGHSKIAGLPIIKYAVTKEDYIARAFNRLGPVVALERPDRPLNFSTGIAKLHVVDWQNEVLYYMNKSVFIVMAPDISDGVLQELKMIVKNNYLNKTVFAINIPDTAAAKRFEKFKHQLKELFNISIENYESPAYFIYFENGNVKYSLDISDMELYRKVAYNNHLAGYQYNMF